MPKKNSLRSERNWIVEEQLLKRVKIEKLADLETKIIGVVVVVLAVGFLGKATDVIDCLASFL